MRGLGLVPQARAIFKSLTVEENLFVGLKGRPRAQLSEAYEMFPRLKERQRNLGSQLSGGEQQMLVDGPHPPGRANRAAPRRTAGRPCPGDLR